MALEQIREQEEQLKQITYTGRPACGTIGKGLLKAGVARKEAEEGR